MEPMSLTISESAIVDKNATSRDVEPLISSSQCIFGVPKKYLYIISSILVTFAQMISLALYIRFNSYIPHCCNHIDDKTSLIYGLAATGMLFMFCDIIVQILEIEDSWHYALSTVYSIISFQVTERNAVRGFTSLHAIALMIIGSFLSLGFILHEIYFAKLGNFCDKGKSKSSFWQWLRYSIAKVVIPSFCIVQIVYSILIMPDFDVAHSVFLSGSWRNVEISCSSDQFCSACAGTLSSDFSSTLGGTVYSYCNNGPDAYCCYWDH